MRFIFFLLLFVSYPVSSSQNILGHFATMHESECFTEIHLFEKGNGVFIDTCLGKSSLYTDMAYKENITWKFNQNILSVNINGINETFTYYENVSCDTFGEQGKSNALIGLDMYFWKSPVSCK